MPHQFTFRKHARRRLRPAAPACLLLAVTAGALYGQSSAAGRLTIGKDTFELKYAAAALVPDSSDKTKTATRIVLADKPIPADVVDDEGQIWDLKEKGYHGLQVDITQDKANYSLFVISDTVQGTVSRSGTFHPEQLSVFTEKRVEGAFEVAPEEHAGTTIGYSVKFAAAVAPREAAPTPADAAAAAGKVSTRAYLALTAAIRAGDKQKILEMSPPDRRAAVDTPQFPEMLKMAQLMLPQNIQVLKATETGDTARLVARGSVEGKPQRGKIYMTRLNGKWIMASETWGAE